MGRGRRERRVVARCAEAWGVTGRATPEEMLKSIMNAPVVRCDQVQWSFLGISMAGLPSVETFRFRSFFRRPSP